MNEDDLYNLSDEELEVAFKAAQAEENSPETELEEKDTSAENEQEQEQEEEFEETYDEEGNLITSKSDEDEDADKENLEEETESEDSSEESTEEVEDEDKTSDESEKTSDEEEEDDSEKTDKEKDKEQPAQSYKFKANGKDYDFSTDEIVDQFPKIFGQAMDYTKKMQAIKPWRKTIDAIEGAKLNHDDINLMIDVLKGDKTAITEVLKRMKTATT
jgi:chemotaxis protein histidine kinase CheA